MEAVREKIMEENWSNCPTESINIEIQVNLKTGEYRHRKNSRKGWVEGWVEGMGPIGRVYPWRIRENW